LSPVWGAPQRLGEPISLADHDEASPAISLAGDELWFGGNPEDDVNETDIWYSALQGSTWSEPVLVEELSSKEHDIPRQPGMGGLVMPLSSRRGADVSKGSYRIYFATWDAARGSWSTPSLDYLENVNASAGEFETADGFLTKSGLELYFSSTRDDGQDLYVARRNAVDQPFGTPEPLSINTPDSEERDPWLSEDETELYFVSDREGRYVIYRATKR
jgi:hypothetical protein